MKTRKYSYTCEHPGSDVIITSDKPMNRPICPLCASVMRSFYDRLLGVPASGKKDCPGCGATPLTVFFRCSVCGSDECKITDFPPEGYKGFARGLRCSSCGLEYGVEATALTEPLRVQGLVLAIPVATLIPFPKAEHINIEVNVAYKNQINKEKE